ncbi:MAG: hypothetical protein K8H86_07700, partial [Ignavibacteriaceae bacterium]|nr:hypothetical protein [Ignavibacteriaceae bacterium]
MMKIKLIYLFLVILSFTATAQISNNFEVKSGDATVYIPVYERQGLPYISVKHLADALRINYYVNEITGKVELKFDDYNLTITPKNPFFIIDSKKDSKKEIDQLPTSTYQFDGIVFIPLDYSLPLIEKFYDKKLTRSGNLQITTNDILTVPVEEKKIVEDKPSVSNFDITGISIDQKANGTLIRINSKIKISDFSSSYNSGIISVILRNAKSDVEAIKNTPAAGLIKEITARNTDVYT